MDWHRVSYIECKLEFIISHSIIICNYCILLIFVRTYTETLLELSHSVFNFFVTVRPPPSIVCICEFLPQPLALSLQSFLRGAQEKKLSAASFPFSKYTYMYTNPKFYVKSDRSGEKFATQPLPLYWGRRKYNSKYSHQPVGDNA